MLGRAFDSQLFYAFFRPDVPVRFKSVASLKTGNGPRWHVSVNCSGKMCLEIIEMEAHFCLTACVFGPRPGPHPRTPRAFADRPLDWTGRGEAGKAGKALGSLGSSTAPWQVTRGASRGFSAPPRWSAFFKQESFFPSNAAAVFLGRRRFCPRFPAVCARARALHRGPGAARSLSHTQPERTRRCPGGAPSPSGLISLSRTRPLGLGVTTRAPMAAPRHSSPSVASPRAFQPNPGTPSQTVHGGRLARSAWKLMHLPHMPAPPRL